MDLRRPGSRGEWLFLSGCRYLDSGPQGMLRDGGAGQNEVDRANARLSAVFAPYAGPFWLNAGRSLLSERQRQILDALWAGYEQRFAGRYMISEERARLFAEAELARENITRQVAIVGNNRGRPDNDNTVQPCDG